MRVLCGAACRVAKSGVDDLDVAVVDGLALVGLGHADVIVADTGAFDEVVMDPALVSDACRERVEHGEGARRGQKAQHQPLLGREGSHEG